MAFYGPYSVLIHLAMGELMRPVVDSGRQRTPVTPVLPVWQKLLLGQLLVGPSGGDELGVALHIGPENLLGVHILECLIV